LLSAQAISGQYQELPPTSDIVDGGDATFGGNLALSARLMDMTADHYLRTVTLDIGQQVA
jgi:hypothetical protein